MEHSWHSALLSDQQSRHDAKLWRKRNTLQSPQQSVITLAGRDLTNFSSNDYLGLANHPQLVKSAIDAAKVWGLGSGASHLVCGHQRPHHELELVLAEFVGAEKALLFSSGYMANLALSVAFVEKNDLVLQDKLNHASLIDGARLSSATFKRYAHKDLAHAERILQTTPFEKSLLMTDSVFSMDGDAAPLKELKRLADSYNGVLIVDDAHGFGVTGKSGQGSLAACEIKPCGNVLMMGTLGKALGSYGAFVAGDAIYIEQLIQNARSYIYTTAVPALLASASLQALCVLREEGDDLRRQLANNIERFRRGALLKGFSLLESHTAIQPWLIGDEAAALTISERLFELGFYVTAIRPPTVPKGTARLRITLSAAHSSDQVDALLHAMEQAHD